MIDHVASFELRELLCRCSPKPSSLIEPFRGLFALLPGTYEGFSAVALARGAGGGYGQSQQGGPISRVFSSILMCGASFWALDMAFRAHLREENSRSKLQDRGSKVKGRPSVPNLRKIKMESGRFHPFSSSQSLVGQLLREGGRLQAESEQGEHPGAIRGAEDMR